ncbi:hypothetical protein [Photobacterium sp. R1]
MAIRQECFTRAREWVRPTVSEVAEILADFAHRHSIHDDDIGKKIGVNQRSVKRWREHYTVTTEKQSNIPYAVWAFLVLLTYEKMIVGHIINADLSDVPKKYICEAKDFSVPPPWLLCSFIGKHSHTGLTRIQIASIFKLNSESFGNTIIAGSVNYVTWSWLLILCGQKPSFVLNSNYHC